MQPAPTWLGATAIAIATSQYAHVRIGVIRSLFTLRVYTYEALLATSSIPFTGFASFSPFSESPEVGKREATTLQYPLPGPAGQLPTQHPGHQQDPP